MRPSAGLRALAQRRDEEEGEQDAGDADDDWPGDAGEFQYAARQAHRSNDGERELERHAGDGSRRFQCYRFEV